MTKEEKKNAKDLFEKNGKLEKLYLNPKGEFFTKEGFASASLAPGEKLTIVTRSLELSLDTETKTATISELKEQLSTATELPAVEQLLKDEQEHENPRKGAIEALEAKIEELKEVKQNGES